MPASKFWSESSESESESECFFLDFLDFLDFLAEDFSFFQQEIPGMYFFIGGSKEGVDPRSVLHHSPDFYVDDSAMQTGIRSMVALTLDFISKNNLAQF